MRASERPAAASELGAAGGASALGVVGTWICAAVSAGAFVLSFPPVSLWWLAPVAAACVGAVAIAARSGWGLAIAVAVCWTLAWAWLEQWIAGVSEAGFPALVAYLAVWSLAHAFALRFAARSALGRRIPVAILLPTTWVGLEFARASLAFDGYPWYLLGHPLAEAPVLIQGADLLGVPLVSALVALVAGAAIDLWTGRFASRRGRRILIGCAAALMLLNWFYGMHRLRQTDEVTDANPGPLVLAIQTNVPQSNKVAWAPQQQIADFDDFRRLTIAAFSESLDQGRVPDIVAWPETMLPGFGLEPESIRMLVDGGWFPGDGFASGILDLAATLRRPLVVGSASFEGLRSDGSRFAWDRHFNSVYVLTPEGDRQRYDKVFLTPFGEVMPYISAWPWLEERLLDIGARGMRFDLEAGTSTAPLRAGSWAVATPICFEDTVAAVCRDMAYGGVGGDPWWRPRKRADLFLNLSNDGWFGASDAGRAQHAQIARFRCVESRLPMVRCVNTGLTLSIDSAGRLRGAAFGEGYGEARRAGSLATAVALDPRVTVYAVVGDVLGWIAAGASALLLVGCLWSALKDQRQGRTGPRAVGAPRTADRRIAMPARRRTPGAFP